MDDHPDYKAMIPDGQTSVVRDPKLIDQLNFTSKIRPPRITNTTNYKLSTLTPRKEMLDKIEIHQNMLWKFGDSAKNIVKKYSKKYSQKYRLRHRTYGIHY